MNTKRTLKLWAFVSLMALLVVSCASEGTDGTTTTTSQSPATTNASEPTTSSAQVEPTSTVAAFDAEAYFEGEIVRILIGFSPGGGFDTYARLLARHLPDHIPGNPSVIAENMPGAGGLVAAGFLHDQAEPDGLTFGTFGNFALQQAVGDPTLTVDITEFAELGDLFPEPAGCIVRTDVASSVEELASASDIKLGDTAVNTSSALISQALREFLGVQTSLVTGYEGSGEIQLAMERGEVDGYCSSIGSLLKDSEAMRGAGEAFIFTYVSAEPLGDQFESLPDELWIGNLTDDPAKSELIVALASAARGYHKHFAAPQDTPTEVVEVLRTAIADTVSDPAFLADAEQAGRLIAFISGEEVERRIQAALDIPSEVRDFVAGVLLQP